MTGKRRALGRGLAALIPAAAGTSSSSEIDATDSGTATSAGPSAGAQISSLPRPRPPGSAGPLPEPGPAAGAGALGPRRIGAEAREGLRVVGIEEIHPARDQPRKTFDDARLEELASSIRTQGLIQPLVVRLREAGGYEIIAGERRWRAAQRAGLHALPVLVREMAHERAFELAMVENLQREDLNPIEEAEGFDRLIREFGYSQEALANRVGKDRTTITNALRLLKLPTGVRGLVIAGRLSMGHARAILGLETRSEPGGGGETAALASPASQGDLAERMERLARRVAAREMSVRQVEALVRSEKEASAPRTAPPAPGSPTATASGRDLAIRLSQALGTRVRVVEAGPGRGHLEIHYHSLDQLDGLLGKLLP